MSAILAIAVMFTSQASASALDIADAKCMATMIRIKDRAAAKDKPGAEKATMFFLGKIVGRSGTGAVSPALTSAADQMKPEDAAGFFITAEQCMTQVQQATPGT